MNKDTIIQYAVYALWATLVFVLTLIINRKVKQRQAAKKAKLNPSVNLYPYEFPQAKGEITFFFDADSEIEYEFFVESALDSKLHIFASGKSRVGGQKIKFDTSTVENGVYFYGIRTPYQRLDKRVEIVN